MQKQSRSKKANNFLQNTIHHKFLRLKVSPTIFILLVATLFLMNTGFDTIAQQKDLDPTNIAQFKPTQQSSIFEAAHSNRAVDGNIDGNWGNRSVSHTNGEPNPWWQVDLLQSYDISEIIIYNRTDCCGERLDNFTVRVSDSPFNGNSGGEVVVNNAKWTSVNNKLNAFVNSKLNSISVGKRGRYIRIHLNNQGWLSLAEVVVRGTNGKKVGPLVDNLALGKEASQISTAFYSPAHLANDGDINTQGWDFQNWNYGSVTHTDLKFQPWWQVDLEDKYLIKEVIIYNRSDAGSEKLSDFNIKVKADSDSKWRNFGVGTTGPPTQQGQMGRKKSYPSTVPSVGRYVRVQLEGTNHLQLAEVVIKGDPAGDLVVGNEETKAIYRVNVFKNGGGKGNIESEVGTSITEGFDFSNTISKSEQYTWNLSVTAKATVETLWGGTEFETTASAGGQYNNSSSTTAGTNFTETDVKTQRVKLPVPGYSTYYEVQKFVINQREITYTLGDVPPQVFPRIIKSRKVGNATVMIYPNNDPPKIDGKSLEDLWTDDQIITEGMYNTWWADYNSK